jgi:FixJ family two-component response regulator
MKNSHVIIVEDDTALRQSLTEWLRQEHVISGFASAEDFLAALNDFEFENDMPTCMLLDFQMPGMNGVALQTELKRLHIECPIVFMSGNAQHADIIEAWRGGAIDFLLKPFSGNELSDVLNALFLKTAQRPITHREAEVLLLLGNGQRQSEAANKLNITLRTIKMHRANLKNKLGLNNLFELTRFCDAHRIEIEKIAQG